MSVSLDKRWGGARGGFTLTELLVVVALIALLLAILLPSIGRMRERARTAFCLSNLRQIGQGMNLYTLDNRGYLPPRGVDGTYAADPSIWPGPPGYPTGKSAYWTDQIVLGQYVGNTNGDNSDPKYVDRAVKKKSPFFCPSDQHQPDDGREAYEASYGMGLNFTWAAYNHAAKRGYANLFKFTKFNTPGTEMAVVDAANHTFSPGGWEEPYSFFGTRDTEPGRTYNFSPDPKSFYNWAKRHNEGGANVLFLDGHGEFVGDLKVAYDKRNLTFNRVAE